MASLLQHIQSALGGDNAKTAPASPLEEEVGKFITEKWTDLKTAYWIGIISFDLDVMAESPCLCELRL